MDDGYVYNIFKPFAKLQSPPILDFPWFDELCLWYSTHGVVAITTKLGWKCDFSLL
jgi:hypothetical protein